MAQTKKNCYFVTELKENASTGDFVSNVFHYDDTENLSALDQAQEKYYQLLAADWNDTTYDYVAVNVLRIADNMGIMGSYKDSRLDPEPIEP